ncbi:hypothetical protein [Rhodococcus tukisamuensis]|uniref:Secreted protein n=1 Tax=Rhodococcus tukisamuensis TaxID=168276 RepID=A0A1G6NPU1_9NOCA|nr:hypothetical protein [Rhodococcus tukisamuensis]SDC69980.1 hypothetical protein SAMN05444580_101624 [Rhodococcus tukisamuensis]
MCRTVIRRSFVARVAASVAALALPLCASAAATANPPRPPTTAFQVPVRFLAGCVGSMFPCWTLPTQTTVTPTATPGVPGEVIFAAQRAAPWAYCSDMTVNWRNLTTGAAGTTTLRIVARDYTRNPGPEDWCRYAPATAVTGGGTVAATAAVDTVVPYGMWGYKIQVNPGLGTLQVP